MWCSGGSTKGAAVKNLIGMGPASGVDDHFFFFRFPCQETGMGGKKNHVEVRLDTAAAVGAASLGCSPPFLRLFWSFLVSDCEVSSAFAYGSRFRSSPLCG